MRCVRAIALFSTMLKRGNRLSITPVTQAEWNCVLGLLERK